MSDKTITIWTCDRCEEEVRTDQGAQPSRWAGVTIVHPPRASGDTDRARRVQLCGECDHDLGFFLNPVRKESEGRES